MIREHGQPDSSACPTPGLLLRHMLEPEGLTEEQCEEISLHVAQCNRCAGTYNAMCSAHLGLMEEARQTAGIPEPEPVSAVEVERLLARTWQRIHAVEAAERRQHRRALIFRIGAMAAAACILIAIGVGLVMIHRGDSSRPVAVVANGTGVVSGFAERVTADGRKPLALNELITVGDQPREILLGGMHRVVMNRRTMATFTLEPQRTEGPYAGKIPYQIQLTRGELYVEVVPGHPFTVSTANARLDITGTKFDVVAESDETELTLLKGSVRFSTVDHPQEAVSVVAGHASTIIGRHAPSTPRPVDAAVATAWARDLIVDNALATVDRQVNVDLSSLGQAYLQPRRPDVSSLDYADWRDAHREWFAREFPWVFAAQKVFADRHIEADYIDLLMVSGDLWQFQCDPSKSAGQPMARANARGLARLANHYGLPDHTLLDAARLAEPSIGSGDEQPHPGRETTAALRRWQAALAGTVQPSPENLRMFSLRASQYLAQTRTAAYLWVKNHPQQARELLADATYRTLLPEMPSATATDPTDVITWLKQLHAETAIQDSIPAAMNWLLTPPGSGCDPEAAQRRGTLADVTEVLIPTGRSAQAPRSERK